MGPEHFWYGGWMIFPMMMPIIMLGIFFIVLYFVFGRGGFRLPWGSDSDKQYTNGRDSESAIEILKKRYAKGEINKEEFEEIRKDLES